MFSPKVWRHHFFVFFLSTVSFFGGAVAKFSIFNDQADLFLEISGGLMVETNNSLNANLLNWNNCEDQLYGIFSVFDWNTYMGYGQKTFGHSAAEAMCTMRNKSIWGNKRSLGATTRDTIKFLDFVGFEHRHNLPYHFLWIRELWLRCSINDLFGLHTQARHEFTLGAFPFKLGRGISLGAAFNVGPELLGFYTDADINQYAFGVKLSGDLVKEVVSYDVYGAILDNKSSSISDTGARIYGQEFGRIANPIRGFGKVSYVTAARLVWSPLYAIENQTIVVEPYILYAHAAEQKVEFLGDAKTDLATFGLACDYITDCFEFSFEFAKNIGSQKVKGWDRNGVELQNRNGMPVMVNSHVLVGVDPLDANAPSDLGLYKVPFTANEINAGVITKYGKDVQEIINNRSIENETQNGMLIGQVDGFSAALPNVIPNAVAPATTDQLYNAKNRFRNPYKNILKGYMFVADAAWIPMKNLKIAVAAGLASGDDLPNYTSLDGDYNGFIGLQEIYSGKTVRSAFVLGGMGKITRPLSAPPVSTALDPFARTINGFTNLIYLGSALYYNFTVCGSKFSFNPNILSYWNQFSTPKFDVVLKKDSTTACARNYLGTEVNVYLNVQIVRSVELFCTAVVFFPGGHFKDIKGKPVNKEQLNRLKELDKTGFSEDLIPNIGNSIAYAMSTGITFKF